MILFLSQYVITITNCTNLKKIKFLLITDDQFETDELAKYSRKPRLLSAETVEIFTKNFSTEEIERETENCVNFNRIGTMNNFLYFSFRIYLDGDSTIDATGLNCYEHRLQADNRTNCKEDLCVIV